MSTLWVVKSENGEFLGVKAEKAGRVWRFSGPERLRPEVLRGRRVIAVEDSSRVYFSRSTLTKGPREVLALQAEDQVRETGIFPRSFQVAYHPLSEVGAMMEVALLAVEPEGVKRLLELLGGVQARLQAVHHQALALAYLGAQMDPGPLLVARLSDQDLWLVVVDGGQPAYVRYVEVDEFVGLEGFPLEENLLAVLDYYERFFGKKIARVLPCGPRREIFPEISYLERVGPLAEGISAEEDLLLSWPEVVGAVFVPRGFNLLPEDQQLFLSQLEWARKVGMLFFVLVILGYFAAAYLYRSSQALTHRVESLEVQLSQVLEDLKKRYPPEEISHLKTYLDLKERFEAQPRMDEFLWWLATSLPRGMRVAHLQVGKGQRGTYEINMRLLYEGGLEEARRAFYALSRNIRKRAQVLKQSFFYDEGLGKAQMELRLRPQ